MNNQWDIFARPANPFQRQWYRVLLARKVARNLTIKSSAALSERTYDVICGERYQKAFRQYNRQFCREIEQLVLMQPNAIDAMRVHRAFSRTTLSLPLHSKPEINSTLQKMENTLGVKDRQCLRQIQKYGLDLKHF